MVESSTDDEFQELYERHYLETRGYAFHKLSCRDLGVAEELTQESFLRLYAKLKKQTIKDARSYLFATLRNLLAERWRDAKRMDATPVEDMAAPEDNSFALLFNGQHGVTLPPQLQRFWDAHLEEGGDYEMTAKRLGWRKEKAYREYQRLVDHLQRRVDSFTGKLACASEVIRIVDGKLFLHLYQLMENDGSGSFAFFNSRANALMDHVELEPVLWLFSRIQEQSGDESQRCVWRALLDMVVLDQCKPNGERQFEFERKAGQPDIGVLIQEFIADVRTFVGRVKNPPR